jgi:hypothetical protein
MHPPEPDDLRSFAQRVLRLLEAHGIEYAICGSMAAMEYGEPRLSIDVDLMLWVESSALPKFIHDVEMWGVYVTPWEVVRSEMLPLGRPFNIIDGSSGSKIDLYPVDVVGLSGSAVRRRQQRVSDFSLDKPVWFLAPEDVILYKLRHYRAGGEVAQKHPEDITKILRISGRKLDLEYIELWARKLDVADLWTPLRSLLDEG